jgi:hypothetical protein
VSAPVRDQCRLKLNLVALGERLNANSIVSESQHHFLSATTGAPKNPSTSTIAQRAGDAND